MSCSLKSVQNTAIHLFVFENDPSTLLKQKTNYIKPEA